MRLLRIAGCGIVMSALAVACNEQPTAVDDVESPLFKKGGNPGGGGGVTWLTTGSAGYDNWPSFSPLGDQVLFSRWEEWPDRSQPPHFKLFVVPTAGGATTAFEPTTDFSATRAAWSPDGKIAVSGVSGPAVDDPPGPPYGPYWGRAQVRVLDLGSWSDPLDNPGLNYDYQIYPSWYADGQRLAVMDVATFQADFPLGGEIKRIDLLGGDAWQLTSTEDFLAGPPAVSPTDDRWIAFEGQVNNGVDPYYLHKNSIWLLCDGTCPPSYTAPIELVEFRGQPSRYPAWHPDGKRLAYQQSSTQPIGRSYAVFVMNVFDSDGKLVAAKKRRSRRVTSYDLNAWHPKWSPDGTHLVFQAAHPDGGYGIAMIEVP